MNSGKTNINMAIKAIAGIISSRPIYQFSQKFLTFLMLDLNFSFFIYKQYLSILIKNDINNNFSYFPLIL